MPAYALDHVQLAMPRGAEDEARAFYGGILGLEEEPKPDDLARRGGVWFASPSGLRLHLGVETPFVPARKAHPGILVDDLDALADVLAATGRQIEIRDDLPGHRRFHVDDCFGNRLEFLQPMD